MKHWTRFFSLLLAAGILLMAGGFFSGGRLGGRFGFPFIPSWVWHQSDGHHLQDTVDSANPADWHQDLKPIDITQDFDRISLDLGNAACTIVQGDSFSLQAQHMTAAVRGNTLHIQKAHGRHILQKQRVLLVLPADLHLKELSIDAGASAIDADTIQCGNFILDAGAASVRIGSVSAADKVSIDTGASAVRIDAIDCRKLEVEAGSAAVTLGTVQTAAASLDVGMGSLTAALLDSLDTELDCAGKITLRLAGTQADYTIAGDVSMGALIVDGEKRTGESTLGDGARRLEASVGIGAIHLTFEG